MGKKGGKIQITTCGPKKRKCVKVDQTEKPFGDPGERYMILDGY